MLLDNQINLFFLYTMFSQSEPIHPFPSSQWYLKEISIWLVLLHVKNRATKPVGNGIRLFVFGYICESKHVVSIAVNEVNTFVAIYIGLPGRKNWVFMTKALLFTEFSNCLKELSESFCIAVSARSVSQWKQWKKKENLDRHYKKGVRAENTLEP